MTLVIIFCGIPGCGKTTIAKKVAKKLARQKHVRLFVSDQFRPPVYQKFFTLFRAYKKQYDVLIFDATFYKKRWRDYLKQLAGAEKTIIVFIKCALATALERNRRRTPHVPEKAIRIITHQLEAPVHPDLIIDTDVTSAAQAAAGISDFLEEKIWPANTKESL